MPDAIITYRCSCMVEEAVLLIRERQPNEDVVAWLDEVVRPAITRDHRQRSPTCKTGTAEYVHIPVDDDGRVGDAQRRQ